MIQRCYAKKQNVAYTNCSVHPDWIMFSGFKKWAIQQDWKGNQLDKDLLIEGNKQYGPDSCLFVSGLVNKFLTDRKSLRGKYPIGVSLTPSGRFCSRVNKLGSGYENLGTYETPEEAHCAYRLRKAALAKELSEEQTDERVSKALLYRYIK